MIKPTTAKGMSAMLRAINTDTTRRPARIQAHRARNTEHEVISTIDEYYREEYISFIIRLLHRVKTESLHEIMNLVIDKIDDGGNKHEGK